MNDFTFQDFPATVKKTSSPSRKKIIIFIVLLLVGVALIGGGAYLNSQSELEATPTPSPVEIQTVVEISDTPTPVATTSTTLTPTGKATPIPTGSSAKKSITVDVLNGSGEAGVAKTAADLLIAAGYTIGKTGNADSFDYTDVVIQIKASQNKFLSQLRTDLAKSYTIGSTSANLSPSQTADAVVIIGKE